MLQWRSRRLLTGRRRVRSPGGALDWFPVKLTRLKRRAENAEELVRLQPPGLGKRGARSAEPKTGSERVVFRSALRVPRSALESSVREASGSLPGSQPGRAGSNPAGRSTREGDSGCGSEVDHGFREPAHAGSSPAILTHTPSDGRGAGPPKPGRLVRLQRGVLFGSNRVARRSAADSTPPRSGGLL
jgi:hypothetical protein